jgi:hypothetical protein
MVYIRASDSQVLIFSHQLFLFNRATTAAHFRMAEKAVENTSGIVEKPPQDLSAASSSKDQDINEISEDAHDSLSNLPRKDGGKAAWLFLAAAFVVEVLTIGECLIWFSITFTS